MTLSGIGLVLNFLGSLLIAISVRVKHSAEFKVVRKAKEYDVPTANKILNETGIWVLSGGFFIQILRLILNCISHASS